MVFNDLKRLLILFPLLVSFSVLKADDPGITKVRLIQETDTSYVFELDISAQFLWSIAPPIMPERFSVSDPVYKDQAGWITVKAIITTSGAALSHRDEIILPWQRAGADITVQWLDGSSFKGLFNRSLEGIHIPMSELMPVQKSTWEVFRESFIMGARHFPFKMIHPLLILVLVWLVPSFRVIRHLFLMTIGSLSAMVLAELGVPGFDLLFGDLLMILLIFLVIYSITYKISFRYVGLLLFFAGVLHGLSFVTEIREMEMVPLQRIQALFAFQLAMDLGHYLFALLLLALLPLLQKYIFPHLWFSVLAGSLSVFMVLLVFGEHIVWNKTWILALENNTVSFKYKTYVPPADLTARQARRGKGMMTTPLMVFLSVEPYEVRQEILIQASEAIRYSSAKGKYMSGIPVESQEQIKREIQDSVSSSNTIFVNGRPGRPAKIITNFVTLSKGGVAPRVNPVEENLNEAIIGITYVYDVEAYPDSILMEWGLFPESLPFIEASAVDPHGALTTVLSPEASTLAWKSRLAGYQVPAIEAITVEKQALPLISMIIWGCLLLLAIYRAIRKRPFSFRYWMMALLVVGFLAYPFIRMQTDLPFLSQGKPSPDRAGVIMNNLLSNLYRAFDRRNENDVYDRLAISVSGNQLTQIYMQNRQSMALENRGGARAKVDEVNIQELKSVKRAKDQGYIADTQWSVRGSVNHFGHTHYRQNQYRALVSFGIEGDSWKINRIEIIDTRRIY